MANDDFKKTTSWDIWYIYGHSVEDPNTYELSPSDVVKYLSKNNVRGFVGNTAPLNPLYIINEKTIPVWFVVFFNAYFDDDALESAYLGKQVILVPDSLVRKNYGSHNNWPKDIVVKNYPDFIGCHPFVLPFMVPRGQSIDSGKIDLVSEKVKFLGIKKFNESKPEEMLQVFSNYQCKNSVD